MSRQNTPRLKSLLDKAPPGFLVDTAWLKKREGIDPKTIHRYVKHGWLEHVVRGVYRRPLPEKARKSTDIDWQVALLSLQWIMGKDIHLGGESALDLAGYAHYLPFEDKPRVHLYGDAPSWLKRLPAKARFVVHNRSPFGDNPIGIIDEIKYIQSGMHALDAWRWPIRVSSPERAILETLDEISPNSAGFDNLSKIFESLTSLQPELLVQLLNACRSVKVRRLFFVFADYHQHAWRKHMDTSEIDFGSGPRALMKGGKLHPTYRIYVPVDFMPSPKTRNAHG